MICRVEVFEGEYCDLIYVEKNVYLESLIEDYLCLLC